MENNKLAIIYVFLTVLLVPPNNTHANIAYSAEKSATKKYVLDNGLTVILREDHSSPLVSMEVRVRAGSATEAEFVGSGISHFVEHMLFKGKARFS